MTDRAKLFLDRVRPVIAEVPIPKLIDAIWAISGMAESDRTANHDAIIGMSIVAWYNGVMVESSEQNYKSIEKAFAALLPN